MPPSKGTLGGSVEIDETYVGGKRKGRRGRGAAGMTAVVGMVERGGEVRTEVTANTRYSTVMPLVRKNVDIGSEVMTEEYKSYGPVSKSDYTHAGVNHSSGLYVDGLAHTSTVEGFWSQLKQLVNGTYHTVSPNYLQNYVDAFSFRYNYR